jgi:hypothetical protein
MATAAQLIANQANAKLSTGPVTPEGRHRASQTATTLGLFSPSTFVRPGEQEIYQAFRAEWVARLLPDGPIEKALVAELVQSAWRLRRCILLEESTPETATAEDLDRMQASIDRARTTAQRAFERNLNELRRTQTDRHMRDLVPYGYEAHASFGAASVKDFDEFMRAVTKHHPRTSMMKSPAVHRGEIAKQSQSAPPAPSDSSERSQSAPRSIPRNAPCPCRSGEKYKRCCGKSAPPVLFRTA